MKKATVPKEFLSKAIELNPKDGRAYAYRGTLFFDPVYEEQWRFPDSLPEISDELPDRR